MTQIFTIIFEDCDICNVEIVKSFLTLEKAKDFLTKYCFDSDMETMMEDEQALFETMWAMKYGESNDEDEEDSEESGDEESEEKEKLDIDDEFMRKEARKCVENITYYEENYKQKIFEYTKSSIEKSFKIPEKNSLSSHSGKSLLTIFHGCGHYTITQNTLE